jgi:hypothetical protein
MRKVGTAAAACALTGLLAAQPQDKAPAVQSPRQAVIEMVTGGEDAFKKHLTPEVQQKLDEMQKGRPSGSPSPTQIFEAAKAVSDPNFESFEAGPVLFSFNNPQERQRWEVRIDSDNLQGDREEMELSLHTFRKGVEEESPAGWYLQLSMQQKQGIWRLKAITVSARLMLADPRILDKSWWNPTSTPNSPSPQPPADGQALAVSESPKVPPARSLRLIGFAEDVYAYKHPENGFTCALSELVEIGRGIEDGESYRFISPEIAQGVYNGYRFSLGGCAGKTVKSFQVTAEPLSGRGKAYCSDQTKTVRVSDDGNGTTCLASGKTVQR